MEAQDWDKYEWLLFDLDNTLLDFGNASHKSFFHIFDAAGHKLTQADYEKYHQINAKYWHYYEKHVITAEELQVNRFKEYIETMHWDLKPEAISTAYLNELVTYSEWLAGAAQKFQEANSNHKVAIITNGLSTVQKGRIAKHQMDVPFFISQDIGASKPHAAYFEHVHDEIGSPEKKNVLVIGDNPVADIKGGSRFGYDTCFFNYKQLKKLPREANYVISEW